MCFEVLMLFPVKSNFLVSKSKYINILFELNVILSSGGFIVIWPYYMGSMEKD